MSTDPKRGIQFAPGTKENRGVRHGVVKTITSEEYKKKYLSNINNNRDEEHFRRFSRKGYITPSLSKEERAKEQAENEAEGTRIQNLPSKRFYRTPAGQTQSYGPLDAFISGIAMESPSWRGHGYAARRKTRKHSQQKQRQRRKSTRRH